LPRDLADVLHYFLPEIDSDVDEPVSRLDKKPSARTLRVPRDTESKSSSALPILGLPIGDRDVVRSTLAWNLVIETARLGASTAIVTPSSDQNSPLWPEPGPGPLGTELVFCPATDLESLYKVAGELALTRADQARRGGIVFVRIPPSWLAGSAPVVSPVRWMLLLTSAHRRDLDEAYELAESLLASNRVAEIGVSIHGVTTIAEAKNAFEYLSRISLERLGLTLASYGLLVNDLHVYRAIAAQRPIGLAHPQAPATRALMDVAKLLYEDARSRFLG
jgi:hypothetical protein